ncbi:MAG: hypothetical protein K2Z80_12365 [Xanthobacteraceae bacterium]|nr:hypothetical protein [Xanthobacteraceae bacterium]
MITLLRTLAIVAGILAIGAVTYGTVLATGGLYTHTAPLYIALGGLQIVIAMAFGIMPSGLYKIAGVLVLIACELATFIGTANLQLADVEARAAPVHDAAAKRKAAEEWVARLDRDDRIQRAEKAAAEARSEAIDASKAKTCATNCKATLAKAVEDASAAVVAARQSLEIEQQQARALLARTPLPGSENALAEKLGLSASTVDLLFVGFRGFAVAFGAAMLLAVGAHPRQRLEQTKTTVASAAPIAVAKPVPTVERAPANVVRLPAARPAPLSVVDFGADSLEPAPGDTLDFDDFFNAYVAAAEARRLRAYGPTEFVAPFKALCEEAGIRVSKRRQKLFLCDVRLAS